MNEDFNIDNEKEILTEKRLSARITQRSAAAQEVISHKPDALERLIVPVLILTVLLCFAMAWFIRFPETVETRVKLILPNSPKPLSVNTVGQVSTIFFESGNKVHKGDLVAVMESAANYHSVMALNDRLSRMITKPNGSEAKSLLGQHGDLGELQPAYQQLLAKLDGRLSLAVQDDNVLYKSLTLQNRYNKLLRGKEQVAKEETLLARERYEQAQSAYLKGTLAQSEMIKEKTAYQKSQLSLPEAEINRIRGQQELIDIGKQLKMLHQKSGEPRQKMMAALTDFKREIDLWMLNHLVKAPESGILVFPRPLFKFQLLDPSHPVAFVIPENQVVYGETYLNQNNFGRIQKGMNVQIRINAYPFQEFGYIEGNLDFISPIASDSGFFASIKLKNGLNTSNNVKIAFQNGLNGDALIYIKEQRLFNKIWQKLMPAEHK
jgi:multidrug resistance efflux pump